MQRTSLNETVASLTDEARREVKDFAEFLLNKNGKKVVRKKVSKFGSGKHLVKWISHDFDEPLEDFKEYME
jgi:hypothetical protein